MADNDLLNGDTNMQEDTDSTYVKEENKVQKKISGKTLGVIAAIIGCVCIAGVVFAKAIVPTVFPKLFVAGAIKTTQKDFLKETKAAYEMMGITLREHIMQSEAKYDYFDLKLKDLAGPGTEEVKGIIHGMGLSGELKNNKAGNNFFGHLDINQNSLKLISSEFYRNEAEIGIAVPELFDKYIAVNLDTFVEEYNQSALYTLIGQPIDEARYSSIRNYIETYQDQKVNDELVKKITQRSEEALKQADVKYIGKTSAKTGNVNKAYKTYELTFKEDEIKSYIKDVFSMCVQTPADDETLSATMKKTIDEFNKGIDEMDALNLKTKLMIDERQHIVETTSEAIVGMDGEKMDVNLDLSLTGNKFITDAVRLSLKMKNDEEQMGLDFTSTSNYGEGKNQLAHNMTLQISENESPMTHMNLDIAYDTKANEDNWSLKADMKTDIETPDETQFSAILEGTMNLNKANKQMNVVMDNIVLNLGGYGEKYTAILEGKYGTQAIKASDIKSKQDNVQYLFKMTQEELVTLIQNTSIGMTEIGQLLMP